MKAIRYCASLMLVLALSLPQVGIGAAEPNREQPDPGRAISSGPLGERASDVVRFWTKERMRNARPADIRIDGGDLTPSTVERGAERVIAPTEPKSAAQIPPAFTRTEIVNVTDVPNRTHGKVFFTLGNQMYVCSATSVTGTNRSLVATAGHCLYDTQGTGFAKSFMFVPGYRNGNKPFGEFVANNLYVLSGYANNDDLTFDFGIAVVSPNSNGLLEDVVGSRGIIFNQSTFQLFDSYGYPANPDDGFDGEKMYKCDSALSIQLQGAGSPLGIGCDMTQGSSGGGWILNDQHLNSVNSFGLSNLPNVMWGPYLGTAASDLYDLANGGPGPSPTPTPTATGTPTPSPSPTGDPTPVTHDMELSLKITKKAKAKGRMTAPDGYLPCTRNAPVGIFKILKNNSVKQVGNTGVTNQEGRYAIKIPKKKGKYFAYGPEGPVDDLNFCSEAYSPVRKFRP